MYIRDNNRNNRLIDSNGLIIKKRSENRENEIFKTTNNFNGYMAESGAKYGDRFVPRRSYDLKNSESNNNKSLYKENKETQITDILNCTMPKNFWLRSKLTEIINECFNIKENRILKFSSDNPNPYNIYQQQQQQQYKQDNNNNNNNNNNNKDWSCKPRTKRYVCFEASHESFGSNHYLDQYLIDWSSNGPVVAGFGNGIIVWQHISNMATKYRINNLTCLSYCPQGRYLALATAKRSKATIELRDFHKYPYDVEIVKRVSLDQRKLMVRSIEWSKCGKLLLCGSNLGAIYVFAVPSLKCKRVIKSEHQHPIVKMRFSPQMRYLASADTSGKIHVLDWFTLTAFITVQCKRHNNIASFDWHPWNGVELAIAEEMPASIVLLHVPSKKITSYYLRKDKRVIIQSLKFNKVTAELLLSVLRTTERHEIESKILVLASLDRLVDELTLIDDERFLAWDPAGTKVITAGTDDTLSLWNISRKGEKENCRKNSSNPNLLSTLLKIKTNCPCDYGDQFRLWSSIK